MTSIFRAKSRLALLLAVGALSLGVSPTASAHGVGPAGVSVHSAPFDEQFIDMMAAHHAMAIQMSRMALQQARHPQVKVLARKMIAAQMKEIGEFRTLRRRWYGSAVFVRYPMDTMMMRSMGMGPNMMRGLMQAGRFDYAFLSAMVAHHSGANTMARWETQSGTHPALRVIATGIIRDQAQEIGQMMQWRVAWYGS